MKDQTQNKLQPPAATNEIPIVFATDDGYVPFCGVTITSIIACADTQKIYSIYIIHTGITHENQMKLTEMSTNNVIIQCVDISDAMSKTDYSHKIAAHFTAAIVYRLLTPELFPQYDKILYLDCDLVVLRDISQLYEVDIGDNVVGGVASVLHEYILNYLAALNGGFPNNEYFNTGVLIVNTKRFAELKIKEKCFELLNSGEEFNFPDQDVLNITCQGNAKFVDVRWNVCTHLWGARSTILANYEEVMIHTASDPWILHYTSAKKPWVLPGVKFSEHFWDYARKSQFLGEVMLHGIKRNYHLHNLPYDKISGDSTIALYGAGDEGICYYWQIEATGLCKVVAWVDRNFDSCKGFDYLERGIESPECLRTLAFDRLLIAENDPLNAKEIIESLAAMGIERQKIISAFT